nr:glycosyltransferase [uncultured Macellibacteroides sp.]
MFHLIDTIVNLNENVRKIFESHINKESIGLKYNSKNSKVKYFIAAAYDNYILMKIKKGPHDGPKEIITDEIDGFLFELDNTTQFAEKIYYLVENEDIRSKKGLNARENVKRYLSYNKMSQWIKLFNTLSN